jgi:hypothetical protein
VKRPDGLYQLNSGAVAVVACNEPTAVQLGLVDAFTATLEIEAMLGYWIERFNDDDSEAFQPVVRHARQPTHWLQFLDNVRIAVVLDTSDGVRLLDRDAVDADDAWWPILVDGVWTDPDDSLEIEGARVEPVSTGPQA